MLERGVDVASEEVPAARIERGVRSLPDYTFTCDGSGGCCAQYPSIALDAADARRALASGMRLLPEDADAARTLMPFDGTGARRRVAMALVEGRCIQLDADGKCAIHRAAGEAAKPKGCRVYPLTFLDDGERVRVSVGFECTCVFTSAARVATDPLVETRLAADLPDGARVRTLPDVIPIAGQTGARRETAIAWMDGLGTTIEGVDVVGALLDGARRLVGEAGEAAGEPPSLDALLASYASAFAAADESSSAWRAESDRIRRMRSIVREASARARPSTSASDAQAEAFFLRASLFGLDYLGPLPIVHAMMGAAARLVIARHVGAALGHPIAVVEATARGLSRSG
jgi:lysine-N-methylase